MPPAEGKHSPIGASSCERWYNCPGSIPRSVGKPNRGSIYAAEGTVAHGLGEDLIRGKITKSALYDREGEIVKCGEFDVVISDEMIEGAILYFDTLAEVLKEFSAVEKPAPVVWKCEEPIHLLSVDEDAWGTCDFAIWRKGDRLVIVDFKFGQRLVDAVNNKQMMYYAVGMMDVAAGWAFDEVELKIVQPRARHADGPVRSWVIKPAQLKQFAAELKEKIALTRSPNAPVAAGDWCKYCPAAGECSEQYKTIQAGVHADFGVIPNGAIEPTAEAIRLLPSVDTLSLDAVGKALAYEDIVLAWFGALKDRARASLEAGVAVPGHKLVRKKTNRKFKDEAEVKAKYEPLLGDAIYKPRELQGITWFEKKIGKDAMAALTMKPEGALTVAPDYDPRAAVVITSAKSDFEEATLDDELGKLL